MSDDPPPRRPRRPLSAEERALWDSVAKQAKPLRKLGRKTALKAPPTPDPSARADLLVARPPQERGEGRETQRLVSPPPILRGGEGSGVGGGASRKDGLRSLVRQQPDVRSSRAVRTTIERRERVKLARGQRDIDARIDLHGMTQARAHRALMGFLHRSQAEGCRYVLVVTGKGRGGGETGVLRRMVPEWLGLIEVRTLVVGFEEASPAHGGGGALYVRMRRG